MTPIDDELRTALQRRATGVAPAPDPLAGIERRAGRMRRNRVAASVAGSVLAVAAVATAVPLLSAPSGSDAPPVAVAQPTASPSPPVTTSAYALDPGAPWEYRGTPIAELGPGFLATVTREYAAKRGVSERAVTLTPLWGQGFDPAALPELAFVATVEGAHRWGIVETGEGGPEFPVDEILPSPAVALASVLPGDGVDTLFVLAAPEVVTLQYSRDRTSRYEQMAQVAPGVGAVQLVGDTTSATFRVLDPADATLLRAAVPEVASADAGGAAAERTVPGSALPTPTNLVDWPLRGAVPDAFLGDALTAAAEQAGVAPEQVASRPLFGSERDGRFYGLVQVWFGGDAQVFAWVRDLGDGSTTSGLFPPTAPGPAVLAAEFDDVLLVVPEPRAGQVLYAPDGSSEPTPVPDQGTGAAVLVDRAPGATDRLLVLDGDGDPERPVLRATVEELLAATTS
jgi:hypothetical protein